MARNRMIKPDFWVDDKVGLLTRDARLLFIGMWNFADDRGYLDSSAAKLKAEVFPHDNDVTAAMVQAWLSELLTTGLVKSYEANGKTYLWVVHFLRHQTINKASKSHIPPHPDDTTTVVLPHHSGSSVPEEKGKEEKEKGSEENDAYAPHPVQSHPVAIQYRELWLNGGQIPPRHQAAAFAKIKEIEKIGSYTPELACKAFRKCRRDRLDLHGKPFQYVAEAVKELLEEAPVC